MRKIVLVLLVLIGVGVRAQVITLLNNDSLPVKHVLVANMIMDESVFSNKKGEVDLTIFQDHDELLQLVHSSYKTIVLPKNLLLQEGTVYLEKSNKKIAVVKVPIISKTKESVYEVVTQTKSISKENIQQTAPATAADMLESTGQVQIQRSQQGGGSPILRGFEASRVLLVVDGVRMNNAIYRSGHLQNAISVDPNLLEGTEVIFGPNSLIYGSDALGGVIHFKTRDPKLKIDSNKVSNMGGMFRTMSATQSNIAHVNYEAATKKFGYIFGITTSSFGSLRMGANRFHGFDDYGKIFNYANSTPNGDEMLSNNDPNKIINSKYSQIDAFWKGLYQPNSSTKYKLNFQHSTTSNVPRTDKLNEYDDEDTLRFSFWSYGPQSRTLVSLSRESEKKTKYYDFNSTILAYQFIEEDRISKRFGSNIQESNFEDVHVVSFNSDFIKYLDSNQTAKLNYGIESLYNRVNSSAESVRTDLLGAETEPIATRYPGGGSDYYSGAIYGSLQKTINDHIFKGGIRYTLSNIVSNFESNEIIDLVNIRKKNLSNQAITSSLGYVYRKGNYKLYSSISSAFKSPNIDDFGKIFEKKGDLTIPNTELNPETSLNYEIGSKFMQEVVNFDAAVFYTQVFNLMTKLPTAIAGDSTVNLNGEDLNLVSVQNGGTANIYGAFGAVRFKASNRLDWYTTVTLTKAHYPGKEGAVPHIPPFYGKSSITYKMKKLKWSIYTRFNGRKHWDEFDSLNDNPDEAIEGFGTPAWATLNASMFAYISPKLKFQLAAENILDTHYKTFASGISAPGRNIIGSVYVKF